MPIPRAPMSLGLLLALNPYLPAQGPMSGRYTVDRFGSGARNFTDLKAAASSLVANGVSGPVEVVVAASTYLPWSMDAVPGASAVNTITIRSDQPRGARIEIGRTTVQIGFPARAAWIILDGFDFVRSLNLNDRNISFYGDDLEIRNCHLIGEIQGDGRRLHVHHNVIETEDSALWCTDVEGYRIHHNELLLSSDPAFDLSPPTGGSQVRTRIYNNVMRGFITSSRNNVGVHVGAAMDFVHNTVLLDSTSSGAAAQVCVAASGDALVRNNILAHLHLGRVLTASPTVRLDHNVYFAPGAAVLINTHRTLREWQRASGQDRGSQQTDPRFASGWPVDPRILPGSPAAAVAGAPPSYVVDDFAGTPRASPGSVGAYEGVPGTRFFVFGSGCAGSGSVEPMIGYAGDLAMGSTTFEVTLLNARGGTGVRAFLAAGATPSTVRLGGGCDLLVAPHLVFGVAVGGASGAGQGEAGMPVPLPNTPALKGAAAHLQWGVVDPAAQGIGLAFSDAATLTL